MDESHRGIRVSDTDRMAAADRLRAALDEGRLDLFEYDTRLGRAYQAVTYADLADLLVDLPGPSVLPSASVPPYPVSTVPQRFPVHTSGVAVAGMVLGILTVLGFWVPFVDVMVGIAAVGVSALGIARTRPSGDGGRGLAVTGLICGVAGLVPASLITALIVLSITTLP